MKRRIIVTHGDKKNEIMTNSDEETQKIGEKIAESLKGGEVLALSGDLGAGKTTFTKGLAKGLGVEEIVTSPTFVLMNVYSARRGRITEFTHIDCYRLEHSSDFSGIGAQEYMNDPDVVVAIEWPERIEKILPKGIMRIFFQVLPE
ncbi:tRNA (adenosine(37)-N6)-threonylcarbamoyltransferase complex ATPase subunit type 1 TsaE [Candidatus Uhrbacteria bacterium]|nr:tRNA (adenosine(37)-N6)-threonylcarbamoyltransferase complex ATPase subunit type 1 TsaE [Candidatus Uhrbacteria bacterium]